ncbi:hypothetical protein [Clostridium estertheticum]|uniref:hypothetical protein n=1 Tax=Clostridium estertheticum TaxID=238834 RepID=UPI001C7DBE4D|nr:hypothetical protein [Clostridium estertheticum]MBX4267191.1 hypothetical protein [Clostridium estertheticum]MBX4272065.1 hypothetical protein [Clostridium estertheticum]WLC82439.1 hypothetical protein KTC98_23975 [Clostridium estertheticum]WLC91313.1 hypothetical protein KTC95_23945 [Clostridium estertheticum]
MIIIQNKKRVIRSFIIILILWSLPIIAQATEINTDISGYKEILKMMKIYVRGAGAIVLMIGSADFFINVANEHTEKLVSSMQAIGAGFFLILADSFVQAIGNANGAQTFELLLSMVGLIISFIGAVLAMLGAYRTFNSIKDRNSENRSKSIKAVVSGLMLVAISQSLSSFLL